MKIGILGTGQVARLLAAAWDNAGHEITLGSRDPGTRTLDVPVKALADTVGRAAFGTGRAGIAQPIARRRWLGWRPVGWGYLHRRFR